MVVNWKDRVVLAITARRLGVNFHRAVRQESPFRSLAYFAVLQFPSRKVWVKSDWYPKWAYCMNWYVLSVGMYPFIEHGDTEIQEERHPLYHSLFMGAHPDGLAHELSEFVRNNPLPDPELE